MKRDGFQQTSRVQSRAASLTCNIGDEEFQPSSLSSSHSKIRSRVSVDESRRSTPPVPPGFEGQVPNESQRSTPTIPPGLTKPVGVPEWGSGTIEHPLSRSSSRASLKRNVSQVAPVLPLRPTTPSQELAKGVRKTDANETSSKPAEGVDTDRSLPSTAHKKELTLNSADAEAMSRERKPVNDATVHAKTKTSELDNDETTNKPAISSLPIPSQPGSKPASKNQGAVPPSDAKASASTTSKIDEAEIFDQKRKRPGKLDISAAVADMDRPDTSTSTPTDFETPNKSQRSVSETQSSSAKVSKSPGEGNASPAVKPAPRTLRVVQTPKAETPPAVNVAAAIPTSTSINKRPSRQPSIASMNPPETPSSDQVSVSDNVSMASAPLSRANSPPPVNAPVSSGSVRTKSKTQSQKERAKTVEAPKAKTEVVKPAVEEPPQEAIVSRKKKTKKEKEPRTKAKAGTTATESTPTTSKPVSPSVKPPPPPPPPPQVAPIEEPQQVDRKVSKPATPTRAPTPPAQIPSSHETSPPPTPGLTAAKLIAELKASTPEIQKSIDSLFRVANSSNFKSSQTITSKDLTNPASWRPDFQANLTKKDIEDLLTGKVPAIHYGGEDDRTWTRSTITSTGAHLRALSQALETRVLELEKALREMPEECHFRSPKPQNETKLPTIDLEELRRHFENAGGRGVSMMEQVVQDGSTMKKGAFLVDEASRYLNEFVMPPATAHPSVNTSGGRGPSLTGAQAGPGETMVPNADMAERQLNESKRIAEEKETALRKMIKKNKRILGLG